MLLALALTLVACGDDLGPLDQAHPAHSVLIAVTVPGPCVTGLCDPPSGGSYQLALIRITNTGTCTAYL